MSQAYRDGGNTRQRIQFGWTGPARPHTRGERPIFELFATGGAAQQQAAAAHVAAAGERHRIAQPVAEDRQQLSFPRLYITLSQ